jgi:hypothetical protein
MARIPPIGDFEIRQDLDLQHRTWTLQHMGRAAMALLIATALSGLFGSGPLARTTVTDSQNLLQIEYDRFGRYEGDLWLQFTIAPGAIYDDRVSLWMDRAYWTGFAVEHITPEPDRSDTGFDGFTYFFSAETRLAPVVIVFHLRPESLGLLDARIRLNDQMSIRFGQFIYP